MGHAGVVRLVEILGRLLVAGHLGVDVGVGPADHAHLGEGRTQLRSPQADITENGHDPHEQEVPELPQRLAVLDVLADLGRELEALPDLLTKEAVPHQVAGLNAEVLPLGALGRAQLRVVVTQRQTPEHHVPRLVLHHIRVQRLRQGILRVVADDTESGQGQPLNEYLHAEIRHVPPAVGDDVVEERLQVHIQGVHQLHFLVQVTAVHLDVARLVDHLRGRVELGVDVGHRLHDLRRADQRALLAVHELAEAPGLDVPAQFAATLLGHVVPPRGAVDRHDLVGHADRVGQVDIRAPVEPVAADPLAPSALVVEAQQLLPPTRVVEVEHGGRRRLDAPFGLEGEVRVGAGRARGHEAPFWVSLWRCRSRRYRFACLESGG